MRCLIALPLLLLATPALAEVKSASANTFEIEHRANVPVTPDRLFGTLGRIGSWWSPAHSYSGKAENLSLELKPGGCFCEALPGGGGVEHLRVSYVDPGSRLVMSGALGPLLYDAVAGVMDIRVAPAGTGSSLILNYRAAGFATGKAREMAPLVDKVLGEQVARLTAAAQR